MAQQTAEKSTSELWRRLFYTSSVDKFLEREKSSISLPSFSDYIGRLCENKGEKPERVIRRANLDSSFGHRLFSGTRKPSRDTVLQLAFGLELGCDVVIDSGGELCVTESMWSETSWYDIDSENWTFWQQNGSVNRITFADNAGFVLQRGDFVTDESFTAALTEAGQALADAPAGHVLFEFGTTPYMEVLNEDITIPSGVIVDVNGWLWVGKHLTVEGGACINVGINGDRNTELSIGHFPGSGDAWLTLNGTISLYADSDLRFDPWGMGGNGSIILYDKSSVPLDGYRWTEAPIDGLFQFRSENAALELQFRANSKEEFMWVLSQSIWRGNAFPLCQQMRKTTQVLRG